METRNYNSNEPMTKKIPCHLAVYPLESNRQVNRST